MWAHIYILEYRVDTKQELRRCVPLSILFQRERKKLLFLKVYIYCYFESSKNGTRILSRKKRSQENRDRTRLLTRLCGSSHTSLMTEFIHHKFLSPDSFNRKLIRFPFLLPPVYMFSLYGERLCILKSSFYDSVQSNYLS